MAATANILMPARLEGGSARVSFEVKSVTDDGTFEGYASLFNREDLGHDVIEPGAFRESLLKRGAAKIKMLFQHNPNEPIGVWDEVREDERGLYVRGRLMLAVAKAREVLALMRAGALDGLSIGFKAEKARREPRSGVRRIGKVDLWEISVVTFPMLPEARVFVGASDTPVGSLPEARGVRTERDFERWLTRERKLTRSEARAVMRSGFAGLKAPRHSQTSESLSDQVAARLLKMAGRIRRETDRLAGKAAPSLKDVRAAWLNVKCELDYARLLIAGEQFEDALRCEPKYSADQPRVSAGNSDGGQWTSGGSISGPGPGIADALPPASENDVHVRVAQADGRPGYSVDILEEDQLGGHTLERHVNKPEEYLRARILQNRINIPVIELGFGEARAGSFTTLGAANKLVNATLSDSGNTKALESFVRGDLLYRLPMLYLHKIFINPTGYEAYAGGNQKPVIRKTYGVAIRVGRSATAKKGYFVHSAWPENDD